MQPAEVLCPHCGAEAGDPCSGTHTFHKERIDAAEVTYAHKTRVSADRSPAARDSRSNNQQQDR